MARALVSWWNIPSEPQYLTHLVSQITFFAPTDDALKAANLSQYDNATLATILKNHVVQGIVYTTNVTQNTTITTLAGGNVSLANTTTNMTTGNGQMYTLLKRLFTQDSGTEYSGKCASVLSSFWTKENILILPFSIVDNATIVDKNVLTNNGVIQIINKGKVF